jgi:AcrR family transcriptional regulator
MPYHHGDLPRALLEAALEQLQSTTADELSLTKVAASCGVSHAAVYRHFKDKNDFLHGVGVAGMAQLQQRMAESHAAAAGGPRQQLLDTGFSVVRFALDLPNLYRVMFFGHFPTTLRELDESPADEVGFGWLKECVRNWQSVGLLRKESVLQQAITLWVTTHGVASLLISGQLDLPSVELRPFVDGVHERMLDGIAF